MLRSVEKELEIVEKKYKEKIKVSQIEGSLGTSLSDIESEIINIVQSKSAKQTILSRS